MKKICFSLCIALFSIRAFSSDPISTDSMKVHVKKYVSTTNPSLDTSTTLFDVSEYVVKNLWETLEIQLFFVKFIGKDNGQVFRTDMFLYDDCAVKIFGSSFGGTGLLSGIVVHNQLYCTYEWGSGIRRSHVCRMFNENGVLKIQDGQNGFVYMDKFLFVSVNTEGKICVENGSFTSFNIWTSKPPVWFIDTAEHSYVKVVDSLGNKIEGWITAIKLTPLNSNTTTFNTYHSTLKNSPYHIDLNKIRYYDLKGRYLENKPASPSGTYIANRQRIVVIKPGL